MRLFERDLRVEFDGAQGATRLVVPLVVTPGSYRDVRIRITPRDGVTIENRVDLGDALKSTFSRSRGFSIGGSFFASGAFNAAQGATTPQYEVVHLPDFRGVVFRLPQWTLQGETVGIQLAFPVASYDPESDEDHFAEVTLEVAGEILQRLRVPREIHPRAGRILVLGTTGAAVFATGPLVRKARVWGPFLETVPYEFRGLDDLRKVLKHDCDGVHLYTTGISSEIDVDGRSVSTQELFTSMDGLGLSLIFIATCNSVRVVSLVRRTDIGALVAATDNLAVSYANQFEIVFYSALASGITLSGAFRRAASTTPDSEGLVTRSGLYDPMFLDLRKDVSFSERPKVTS